MEVIGAAFPRMSSHFGNADATVAEASVMIGLYYLLLEN